MKQNNISQQSIARKLGVSQALVSLVLNGKRENISEEAYKRIWDYATRMGYRPKGMQVDGNHRLSTRDVGLILRAGLRLHTQSNFFSHVQHRLHTELLARDYHTVFLGSEDDLRARELEQTLDRYRFFGLAILGQVQEKFLNAIRKVQRNVVAISVSYPGRCHSVMPNETQALQLLVEHLLSLGHKRIAWIGGDKSLNYNIRRRAALVAALDERGLKLPEKLVVEIDGGGRLEGWTAAEMMLRRMPKQDYPTAWICVNGMMARGVVSHLLQQGCRVPDQISVVAVDATRVCVEEHPQITGAHADPERIGQKAAELLLQESDDETFTDLVIPSQLTLRQTSGKAQ